MIVADFPCLRDHLLPVTGNMLVTNMRNIYQVQSNSTINYSCFLARQSLWKLFHEWQKVSTLHIRLQHLGNRQALCRVSDVCKRSHSN